MRWNTRKTKLQADYAAARSAYDPLASGLMRLLRLRSIITKLRTSRAWLSVLTLCLGLGLTPIHADVSYVYDELGRLVEVIAPDGTSTQYSYDAVGNVTSVNKASVTTVAITEFTPNSGPVGTVVTIYGSGFNTTAASNTVKFNTTTASVTAATATQLTVTVPTGATTGKITVQKGATTTTSAANFTVGANVAAPTITSFTPTIGNQGAAVTITGTNFQDVLSNKVAFGSQGAFVSASTPTTIFANASSSGQISVSTTFGKALTTNDFFALPSFILPSEVGFAGRVIADGSALTVSTTAVAGKRAVVLFTALTGGNYGLALTGVTLTPAATASDFVRVQVFKPDGSPLVDVGCFPLTGKGCKFNVFNAEPGSYLVTINPGLFTPTAMTMSLWASTDITSSPSLDVALTANIDRPGRNLRYTLMGAATQQLGILISPPTGGLATGYAFASVFNPDGSQLGYFAESGLYPAQYYSPILATTGRYTVVVDAAGPTDLTPSAGGNLTGTVQATFSLNDVALILDGTPTVYRGKGTNPNFKALAGGNYSIGISAITLTPAATASDYITMRIGAPNAPLQTTDCYPVTGIGCKYSIPNATAGTYSLDVLAGQTATTALTMSLWASTDITVATSFNTQVTANIDRPGRNIRYLINVLANQRFAATLGSPTGALVSSGAAASLVQSNGANLGRLTLSPGQSLQQYDFQAPPVTGQYPLVVDAYGTGATGTVRLTPVQDVSATLIVDGAASTIGPTLVGQHINASFTAATGGNYAIGLSALALSPTASINDYLSGSLYDPSGTSVGGLSCYPINGSGCKLVIENTIAGQYTLRIGSSGIFTTQLTLWASSDTVSTPSIGTVVTANVDRPGRNIRYLVNGTVGQTLTILVNGLTGGWVNSNIAVNVYRPDGSYLGAFTLFQGYTQLQATTSALPSTAQYLVEIGTAGGFAGDNATGTAQVKLTLQ
jgi:large repetitive protein